MPAVDNVDEGRELYDEVLRARKAQEAVNALGHDSDITTVQEWSGHANVAARRTYDRRRSKVEDSPTFKVSD